MATKLNTWTLGGLMVGPILGSGILLLPPLVYGRLGSQAVWAWLVVLGLGAAFAAVFIRMALRTRSAAGISELVAREWGEVWGKLAANYLTGAVIFGAIPVCLTAARLWPGSLSAGIPVNGLAALLLLVILVLLLLGLTTVSRVSLVLSTLTAACLVVGGALGLWAAKTVTWPAPRWDDPALGPTLLLGFWAIVGWEVVGNYTNEVRNPDKTIPRAGLISLAAVTTVYLVTVLALQTLPPGPPGSGSMAAVLAPLFGPAAGVVIGVLAGGLCLMTALMFMGAVAGMTAQRLGLKSSRPMVLVLGATSLLILGAIQSGWIEIEGLVSVANLFFLGNALLGLAAAWKILSGPAWRCTTVVLALVLVALVTQGRPLGWVLGATVTGGTLAYAFFKARAAGS